MVRWANYMPRSEFVKADRIWPAGTGDLPVELPPHSVL